MGPGDDGIKGRNFQPGMHGIDQNGLHVVFGQGAEQIADLGFDVVVGQVREVGDVDKPFFLGNKVSRFDLGKLGQAAGDKVGAGVEISGQLGDFRQGTAQGFLGIRRGPGRPDDFTFGGERDRVIGHNPYRGYPGFQRKIGDKQADAGFFVFGQHIANGWIGG